MTLYLDASVLIALLTDDSLSERADKLVRSQSVSLLVSDLATAEFASAIARRVRMREMRIDDARLTLTCLDDWKVLEAGHVLTTSADIHLAEATLRRLDLTLRTADAIHIAVAQRLGATLATFDTKMAACARTLGVTVAA